MPPVTALRSPPDSRITGADSPVIADSSTVAMPSITVPSPGISSPAGTTTTSPRVSSAAAFVEPSRIVATVSLRILRSVSAWARPRPSANASAMFANTTVSHSQTEIVNVYHAGSLPPSDWPPPSWMNHVTVVISAPISTTNITGLRICTRGSSFLKLSISARVTISRWNSEIAWRSWAAGICADISLAPSCESVEREVELEHVHAFLAGEAEPAARGVLGDQPVDRREREMAHGRDAVGLDPGVRRGDFGVEPRGRAVDRVDRDLRRRSGRGHIRSWWLGSCSVRDRP